MKKVNILFILLFLLITSYQSIFPSFSDEILIIIWFGYFLTNAVLRKVILTKKLKLSIGVSFLYIMISLFTLLLMNGIHKAYFIDIINDLKIFMLFILFSSIDLNSDDIKNIMRVYIILLIPNIVIALMEFVQVYIFKINIPGKMRNGVTRLSALSGHPIHLGYIAMSIGLWKIYNKKYIQSLIYVLILFGTQTRLTIVIFEIGIVLIILSKVINLFGKKLNKMFISIIILIIPILVMTNYSSINSYLEEDVENTIRFYSIKKSIEIFKDYPLLGTSIGTFNGNGSLLYNKTIYNKYKFSQASLETALESSSGFESQLARQLIETGIIGVILFYSIFISRAVYLFRKRKLIYGKYILFLNIVNMINSLLNPLYSLPLITFSLISISYEHCNLQEIGLDEFLVKQ